MLCNIYVMVVIHHVTVMFCDTCTYVMYILSFVTFNLLRHWHFVTAYCTLRDATLLYMNDAVFCDVYVVVSDLGSTVCIKCNCNIQKVKVWQFSNFEYHSNSMTCSNMHSSVCRKNVKRNNLMVCNVLALDTNPKI